MRFNSVFIVHFFIGQSSTAALNELSSGVQEWMTWGITVCTSLLGLLMLIALARFVISQR